MLNDIDAAAPNRFADALAIQQGASNPSGVARALVRAINACHGENVRTSEDPAVRLIVHQLAHLCGTWEINNAADAYGQLIAECETKSASLKTTQ